MDAVRTAHRLTGEPVTILYRRTRHEMPAAEEELQGALDEGNVLEELVSPVEIVRDARAASSASGACATRSATGRAGRAPFAGRPSRQRVLRPVRLGRRRGRPTSRTGLPRRQPRRPPRGRRRAGGRRRRVAQVPRAVYAGGDVVIEPGSIISACADGRRAAEAICAHLGIRFAQPAWRRPALSADDIVELKGVRGRRLPQVQAGHTAPARPSDVRVDRIDDDRSRGADRGAALRPVHHVLRQVRRGVPEPGELHVHDEARRLAAACALRAGAGFGGGVSGADRGVPRRAGSPDSPRGRLLQRVRQLPDVLRAPAAGRTPTSRDCSWTARSSRRRRATPSTSKAPPSGAAKTAGKAASP